jgi:hypothetical protein
MSKKTPLIVAGIVFSIVAILHLLRIIYHWEVIIAGQSIPMSVSIVGFVVTAILAIWMFRAASSSSSDQ